MHISHFYPLNSSLTPHPPPSHLALFTHTLLPHTSPSSLTPSFLTLTRPPSHFTLLPHTHTLLTQHGLTNVHTNPDVPCFSQCLSTQARPTAGNIETRAACYRDTLGQGSVLQRHTGTGQPATETHWDRAVCYIDTLGQGSVLHRHTGTGQPATETH